MENPFTFDSLSKDNNFFGRANDLTKLTEVAQYSNNMLLYSKRRMGKTSLIKKFFSLNKDNYLCIYVDIFDITSKEDFANLLLTALSSVKKTDLKQTIKKLSKLFKRVRFEPTIDPNTFNYSIKPIIATLTFEQMMDDFFYALNELSKTQKIVIAIDEFQQVATITDIKLDAFLRKYIQERQNISYLFLGSKRHLLTSLFEYKSPLYEMAKHYELLALEKNDILDYVSKYLKVNEEMVDYIYQRSAGETKMIINICHLLHLHKIKKITLEQINKTVQEIINSKDSSYKMIFDTMSNNQKIALKIIGKYKQGFFANAVLNEYNIKKQTLQSAVDALFKRELIDKNEDTFFIPDRTLELWVESII